MPKKAKDKDKYKPQHLDDKTIKSFKAADKRVEIRDDHLIEDNKLKKRGVKGLVLRITPAGSKSFAVRYRIHGRRKRFTIGKYPDWSLSDARNKAEDILQKVDKGIDPAAEKQKKRSERPETLGEYIETFKTGYIERKLKASTQKTYKSRLNKVTDHRISRIPIKDVQRSDVRSFLKAEAKDHPTNANRLHSILSKVFNEALQDGVIKENPIKGMEKITKEKPRDPRYSKKDLKNIWTAINEEWEPMRSLLKMLMITGQRLGETSRMKWDHIHSDVWIIPQAETKTDSTHAVPLTDLALEVLESVKEVNGTNEYVFASLRDNTIPLQHFGNVIDRIRESAKLPEFILHDLRHIVATGMINLEVDFIHVGRVLNHKGLSGSNTITARYINTDLTKQKRRAMEKWESYLVHSVINPDGRRGAKIHRIGG